MERELKELRDRALAALASAHTLESVERVVTEYLGRHGKLTALMKKLPALERAQRPKLGRLANEIKHQIETTAHERKHAYSELRREVDPTLPGEQPARGHLHPLTQFSRRMLEIWRSFGYDVHEGPELEDDWYNFEGLNIPKNHPSRDIQDTFYIKDRPNLVLRTHSSTVQLRALLHRKPPLKFVEIGRVYRHEATDASHEAMFTQCDGVALGRDLTMANLIATLRTFFRALFGQDVRIRVRPSYFPFVEPGIEMDMEWTKNGKTTWLELLGAGMVHPNVMKAMKLNPKQWKGFAFGMGVDRLMMLDYSIPDIRLSYSGSVAFVKQF